MSIIIDQAKRTRKCGNCNNEIEPKEYHLRFVTFYRKLNLCSYCLQDLSANIIMFNNEKDLVREDKNAKY